MSILPILHIFLMNIFFAFINHVHVESNLCGMDTLLYKQGAKNIKQLNEKI